MHILLNLSGMLVVILLGNVLVLRLLRLFRDWSQRQVLQLLVLMTPLVCLIVLFGGLEHALHTACLLNYSTWDAMLDRIVLLLVGCSIVGALGLGMARFVLMKRVMRRLVAISHPDLEALVYRCAQQNGLPRPCVQLVRSHRPFALLYGIRRPTIVLSTWMLGFLEPQELEAVLVHELVHASRHHYLLNGVALLLRDAFFYLPTSRIAYRQFHDEKELACDDLVAQTTRRPLALASALAKVWLQLADGSPSQLAQSLLRKDELIARRVERLLDMRNQGREKPSTHLSSLNIGTSISIALMNIVVSLALAAALLNCWPMTVA